MKAQTSNASISGMYSLHSVREVASQLWLKPDSSFEFFFSYGAVDRSGNGKWVTDKTDSNRIILNSRTRPEADFALADSKSINDPYTIIKVSAPNTSLLPYTYVKLYTAREIIEKKTNSEGIVTIPRQEIKKIELLFELCPDRFSTFIISSTKQNHFEFRFEPWIAEVFFENIILIKTDNGLTGSHPLMEGKDFNYEKNIQQE